MTPWIEQVKAMKGEHESGEGGQERAISLLNDQPAMRVVVAWTQCGQPIPLEDAAGVWDVEIDFDGLAAAAGLPKEVTIEKLAMLQGMHLIYPDGTASRHALMIVRRFMAEELGLKRD